MPAKKRNVDAVRVENLRLLLMQWNGPAMLARKLQHSGPSYLSQIMSGNRPFTEKTARKIEAKLDLPVGWLDRPHEAKSDINTELFTEALVAVMAATDRALARDKGATPIDPRQLSEIVALAYEHAQLSGHLDEGFAQKLVDVVFREKGRS